MCNLKLYLFAFFLLHFHSTVLSQNVRVIFVNKTGREIDSLVVNGKVIGKLEPDSLSKPVTFDSLTFDSTFEAVRGGAVVDGQRVTSWPDFIFCGTVTPNVVRKGDFLYHITERFIDSREYIYFDPQR